MGRYLQPPVGRASDVRPHLPDVPLGERRRLAVLILSLPRAPQAFTGGGPEGAAKIREDAVDVEPEAERHQAQYSTGAGARGSAARCSRFTVQGSGFSQVPPFVAWFVDHERRKQSGQGALAGITRPVSQSSGAPLRQTAGRAGPDPEQARLVACQPLAGRTNERDDREVRRRSTSRRLPLRFADSGCAPG